MQLVKEITVFLANHPGTLARLAETLAERNINILGFTLTNAHDHGALRMVVSSPEEALHLFGEHNLLALEHEIVMLRLANEPGALSRLASALSEAAVNVDYGYGSADASEGVSSSLFLRVSNAKKALRVLAKVAGVQ